MNLIKEEVDGMGWIIYKNSIIGIATGSAIIMLILMIKQFIKAKKTTGNKNEKSRALQGALWTGIGAVTLGAIAIITFFLCRPFG